MEAVNDADNAGSRTFAAGVVADVVVVVAAAADDVCCGAAAFIEMGLSVAALAGAGATSRRCDGGNGVDKAPPSREALALFLAFAVLCADDTGAVAVAVAAVRREGSPLPLPPPLGAVWAAMTDCANALTSSEEVTRCFVWYREEVDAAAAAAAFDTFVAVIATVATPPFALAPSSTVEPRAAPRDGA